MNNTLDRKEIGSLRSKMLAVVNHAGLAAMTSLGHRSGLFDAMAEMPVHERRNCGSTSLNERYVREWLAAMG